MQMPNSSNGESYFHAGGRRVSLEEADDLLAVDRTCLSADIPALKLPATGRKLLGGLELFVRSQLDDATINALSNSGLTRPVFRHAGSILVLLPEIRVECHDGKTLSHVVTGLADFSRLNITQDSGRLSLTLASDQAHETLQLSNHLFETYPGLSVTPRFVRVAESPKVPQ